MSRNNIKFEDGDEVGIRSVCRGHVTACGVSFVYDDRNEKQDLWLINYKSINDAICEKRIERRYYIYFHCFSYA